MAYTSAVLDQPLEITGHPCLHLAVQCDQPDAALHVYLEEVVSETEVHYITEGILRLSHRATAEPPFKSPVQYHSHLKADHQPLKPGQVVAVAVDFSEQLAVGADELTVGPHVSMPMASMWSETLRR